MALFGSEPKVPNTISDEDADLLNRRAQRAAKESMFSRRNVEKRLASNKQQEKRNLS
jgi:hypothetical protein